jgi:hypothetical protein
MAATPLVLNDTEMRALDAILADHPSLVEAFAERLAPVIEELARTCQGLVASPCEAEDLLTRVHTEFVRRMLAETESWDEDDEARVIVLSLLTRYVLAAGEHLFVDRVIMAKRN